jgi:hypothetical protein
MPSVTARRDARAAADLKRTHPRVWPKGYGGRKKPGSGDIICSRRSAITTTGAAWNDARREAPFIHATVRDGAHSFERLRAGPVRACSGAFAFAVFILLLPVPRAGAAKLGGPYYVDDAEIGKVGSSAPAKSNPGTRPQATAIASPFSVRPACLTLVRRWRWARTC